MPKASVKKFIECKKEQLIDLVLDIEKYPEFVPFCIAAKIYEKKEKDNLLLIVGDLTIGKGPFKDTYKSDVKYNKKEDSIFVTNLDGPLKHLENTWHFNEKNNITRFLVFSKQQTEPTSNDKTSIIFSIKHEPGALHEIIKEFFDNNINLTKIESRPKKGTSWEYNFYLDFVGHVSDEKISYLLDNLKKNTKFLKVIGSYPLAELG